MGLFGNSGLNRQNPQSGNMLTNVKDPGPSITEAIGRREPDERRSPESNLQGRARPHCCVRALSLRQLLLVHRSISLSGQSPSTEGTGGRASGESDHQSYPARLLEEYRNGSIGSLPQVAPSAIHSRRIFLSAAGKGCFGGMSSASIISQRRLSSRSPATIAGPFSPPRKAVARRLKSSFPLGSAPL